MTFGPSKVKSDSSFITSLLLVDSVRDQTMASRFAVVASQQCAFYLAGITSIDLLALQKIDYTLRSLEH
eukprot:scaffold31709_cov41-Cyclotella_meneghiniana.AAC.1